MARTLSGGRIFCAAFSTAATDGTCSAERSSCPARSSDFPPLDRDSERAALERRHRNRGHGPHRPASPMGSRARPENPHVVLSRSRSVGPSALPRSRPWAISGGAGSLDFARCFGKALANYVRAEVRGDRLAELSLSAPYVEGLGAAVEFIGYLMIPLAVFLKIVSPEMLVTLISRSGFFYGADFFRWARCCSRNSAHQPLSAHGQPDDADLSARRLRISGIAS